MLEWFGAPAYGLAFFLVLTPLISIGANNWPVNLSSVRWRYDFETSLSAFVVAIAMGFLVASVVAVGMEHRLMLRLLAVLNILVGIAYVLTCADYMLDGLQLRFNVDHDRLNAFELTVMRGMIIFVLGAVLAAWFGIASYRAAKRIEALRPRDTGAHPLVAI
ncbi:MAG TPA: hypothetical protein VHW65_01770 [Gemmatimonadales bacterium]|nr:hypothetical protein [Gemmatimonadales bacterium]